MTDRVKTVKLVAPALSNRVCYFSIQHAERILALKASGWVLPDDSKFEFDKEYGLRLKANK